METNSSKLTALQKLKQQKDILDARIQQVEERQKVKERKEDTRRKILIGAYFMEKLKKEGSFDSVNRELDSFLVRNSDRKLFGLPVIEKNNEK